jgi:hypothetical protein
MGTDRFRAHFFRSIFTVDLGMPVKTKRDEEKWEKAKELAKEQGKAEDWAYIMGIYKRMKPDYFKSKKSNDIVWRVLARFLGT